MFINSKAEREMSMIKSQIKIGSLELEVDQGKHVIYRDAFGGTVCSAWGDMDTQSKEIIKKAIINAENIIRLSANALWT
jgi:hypothetical protein